MAHTQALLFDPDPQSPAARIEHYDTEAGLIPVHIGEFWTSRQRDAHSIHEVSYRACYKPQLPDFFVSRYARKGSVVYDPFLGRGTTLVQARLHGCTVVGSDINPICLKLSKARLCPPPIEAIRQRLDSIVLGEEAPEHIELFEFYHPDTLREIESWRRYFSRRRELNLLDSIDEWIEMVAINRLSGHSPGFFSVYTLPPNQAVSIERQRKINTKLNQRPEYRNTRQLIWKKTKALLRDSLPAGYSAHEPFLFEASADCVPQVASGSVDLVVTSPPFLDAVDYLQDNWLRLWFCDCSIDRSVMWKIRSIPDWTARMESSLRELHRVLKPGGVIAFEVGEVRKGTVRLELEVLKAGHRAGLTAESVLINTQKFTKTSNCWGIDNNHCGTNSNRIVVFKKSNP
ncbi:MAG: DNA methyltransferase [Verrucomicrobiota bacterium]